MFLSLPFVVFWHLPCPVLCHFLPIITTAFALVSMPIVFFPSLSSSLTTLILFKHCFHHVTTLFSNSNSSFVTLLSSPKLSANLADPPTICPQLYVIMFSTSHSRAAAVGGRNLCARDTKSHLQTSYHSHRNGFFWVLIMCKILYSCFTIYLQFLKKWDS